MTPFKQIGKYKVVRELGRGGMGAVYEAENPEVRHRVAIKILDVKYAQDAQASARFRIEGIAANLPRHPGIVHVLERGLCEDGAPYIVMDYVEGETLRRRVESYPTGMPTSMVIRLARQIADALGAAHDVKVIHRDIKPENVMLSRDSAVRGGERARVLDFGIAVINNKNSDPLDVSLADTKIKAVPLGGLVGTVFYMAPEQWNGTGQKELDDKADVYQLGIVLYEMLTGHPPFVSDSAMAIGYMHNTQEPKPLLSVKPHLPAELAGLVHRMLNKSSSQRPTMNQVGACLLLLEEDLASPSTSQSASIAVLPMPRPTRWLALALGAAICLAALLAGREILPGRRSVVWQVSSIPPGAELIGPGGEFLGLTPWQKQQRRDVGTVSLTLKLVGYRTETIQVDFSQDCAQTIKLERAP